ncbi:YybH family protein [Streptomyces sp. NPDC048172]|uniref:YybH family protein n=1 Tax=Streptomyces sp. NPDC048172 TaxID=3365505 RepID=UPI00371524A1
MRLRSLYYALPAAALIALSAAAPSQGRGAAADSGSRCDRQFDAAVTQYVDAHPARDVEMFAGVLHDGWTVVFPDAEVLKGKKAGLKWVREEFFNDPDWTQTFDEERRVVSGCRTGFVLFDSVYEEPGYRTHLKIGLTFTYEHGRWLVIHDQNTRVPAGG